MLKDADFKPVYASGENEPIECYLNGLLNSNKFDLALGFFSSSGIQALALGFAYFIKREGRVRVIMNDLMQYSDKLAWENSEGPMDIEDYILQDISRLYSTLSKYDKHFFKCLAWLIGTKRLELIAIKPVNGGKGIAHPKFGVFRDEYDQSIAFSGSINFSRTALMYNLEAMSCYRSWEKSDAERLLYYEGLFEKIWTNQYPFVQIVPLEKVKSFISDRFEVSGLPELLREEEALIQIAIEENILSLEAPNPYRLKAKQKRIVVVNPPVNIQIREYQMKAYERWKANDKQGIFAMATGTGKTITALNCVYQENINTSGQKKHHVLILVPTQDLLVQWSSQIESWGFEGVFKVQSGTDWKKELPRFINDLSFGIDSNFVIIATYRSFTSESFQKALKKLPSDTILIADEAHNLGQPNVRLFLNDFHIKSRIGLTATPKRIYDPDGSDMIESFFNEREPYCFSFYMDQAILEGRLCKYDYYPILVNLEKDELDEYINITKKLSKLTFLVGEESKDTSYQRLLLKRKRIVNKAKNKISALRDIINAIKKNGQLKYCFTYAPPGEGTSDSADGENGRIIREMQKAIQEECPSVKSHVYLGETNNREEVLRGFEKGDIDVLLAINCLDEGVDIPRTEIGIFTSSTGNPRQYIQRRGRVLRVHPDKERAQIYDMVIIPKLFDGSETRDVFETEKKLVKNELMRVGYFAKVSDNFYDTKDVLEEISKFYQLDLDTIIKELEE